jgi:hypothetical protein
MLEALLETVSRQQTDFGIEVLVADSGCFETLVTLLSPRPLPSFPFWTTPKKPTHMPLFATTLDMQWGTITGL